MKRRLSNEDICDLTLQSAFPLCDEQDDRFRDLLERFAEVERDIQESTGPASAAEVAHPPFDPV